MGQGKGGDGGEQPGRALDQDQQRQHEQQVVEAFQDMFDAQQGIGARHLQRPRGGFDHKGRFEFGQADVLRCARQLLQPDQHIHRRKLQPADLDGAAAQPAGALIGPAGGKAVAVAGGDRVGQVHPIGGQQHLQPQMQLVAEARHPPGHVIAVCRGLIYFQIGQSHFMGQGGLAHQQKGCHQRQEPDHDLTSG